MTVRRLPRSPRVSSRPYRPPSRASFSIASCSVAPGPGAERLHEAGLLRAPITGRVPERSGRRLHVGDHEVQPPRAPRAPSRRSPSSTSSVPIPRRRSPGNTASRYIVPRQPSHPATTDPTIRPPPPSPPSPRLPPSPRPSPSPSTTTAARPGSCRSRRGARRVVGRQGLRRRHPPELEDRVDLTLGCRSDREHRRRPSSCRVVVWAAGSAAFAIGLQRSVRPAFVRL